MENLSSNEQQLNCSKLESNQQNTQIVQLENRLNEIQKFNKKISQELKELKRHVRTEVEVKTLKIIYFTSI